MSNSRKNRSSSTDKPAARATTEELAKATGQVTEEQPATEEQVPAAEQPAAGEPAKEEQPAVGNGEPAAPAAPAAPAPLTAQQIMAVGKAVDGRTVEFVVEVGDDGKLIGCSIGQVIELPAVQPGSNELVTKGIQFARELISNGTQGSKVHLVRKVALFGGKQLARKQVLEVINAVNDELTKKVGGTAIAPATVFTQFQVARKTGKE